MQQADQLLAQGDLAGARAALVDHVRTQPGDARARMFLFQLLAVAGEWDKAKKQLATLASLSAEAQMLAVVYNGVIAAEELRGRVFAGETPMPLLHAGDWAAGIGEAITLAAAGRHDEAEAARDAAFDAAPDTPGSIDGDRFDWIADADGRFGPSFEAIIGDRYGLITFDQVRKITSEGPVDLRDVVWLPVQLELAMGHSIAAMIPTRYPGSEFSAEDNERMARATGWYSGEAGEVGRGQRLWTTSDGADHPLLALRTLTID